MISSKSSFILNQFDPNQKLSQPFILEIWPVPNIIFQQKFYLLKSNWIKTSQ